MSSSHDLFIKGFLSNLTEAIDFFDSSLPKSMTDLLDLEKLGKKRTIQKELKF